MRIPDCVFLMFRSWVLMEIWIRDLSSSLVTMLMSSSKLFLFSKEIHFNSKIGIVLCYCHQAYCLLYIWAKLTVAFTCTSLHLNLNSCVFGCRCGFGFEQNFGGLTYLARKRHRSVGYHTPIHPLQ